MGLDGWQLPDVAFAFAHFTHSNPEWVLLVESWGRRDGGAAVSGATGV